MTRTAWQRNVPRNLILVVLVVATVTLRARQRRLRRRGGQLEEPQQQAVGDQPSDVDKSRWGPRRAVVALPMVLILAIIGAAGIHSMTAVDTGESAAASTADQRGEASASPGAMRAAPYLYLGGKSVPEVSQVMRYTGVTWITLAFVLAQRGCTPAWEGRWPLTGHVAETITAIRAAGGDVIVSFGGWAGKKLGQACPNARALAVAYQRVIDTYRLRAIDIDVERDEFTDARTQDRVLKALQIVKARNPNLTAIVTMPVTVEGLNSWGRRMVQRAAQLAVPVDVWTIMPFVLGRRGADMGRLTIQASEHTHHQIARYYPGVSAAEIYSRQGISTMNGATGAGETVTQANFRRIRAYVHRRGLARFTFWSLNRDRPCGKGHACSGIPQQAWEFTRIING